jgi:hypothetical protein
MVEDHVASPKYRETIKLFNIEQPTLGITSHYDILPRPMNQSDAAPS